jgi:3',5'-cyclic AMP phosphodiesterase CpdA
MPMPIHVPPISRRSFLARSATAVAVLGFGGASAAEGEADPNFFTLFSDTHVPGDPSTSNRGVNMTDNLARAVGAVVGLVRKPAAVLINGDCAYLKGLPADYANFARLLRPLAEAGVPLHLTMGNHDARGPFYDALAAQRPENPPVASKHVGVVSSPNADWYLLDSLTETDVVTGELGEAQRRWLSSALDSGGEKPAIVMAHHDPQFEPRAGDANPWSGLKDAAALFELLESRPRVKAFVFGHTHDWSISRRGRIHLVNLPPVAYVFQDDKPNGWVEARTRRGGIDLRLRAHDERHPRHGETVSLDWR